MRVRSSKPFCFERFLYRLGKSEARERFVLKGAMLLRLWSDQLYRATRDLDLLRKGDGSFEAIRSDIRTICAVPVEPDAVTFDADAIRIEAIRAENEYAGTWATRPARSGSARIKHFFDLLSPMLEDVRSGARREGTWSPGGPWR